MPRFGKLLFNAFAADLVEFVDRDESVGVLISGDTGGVENVGQDLAVIDPDREVVEIRDV